MIDIDEKSHISVTIKSLEKIYKKAKINGKLESKDIFVLNLIYKLLYIFEDTLTNEEKQKLTILYSRLAFRSENICQPILYKKYLHTVRPTFTQAEVSDCIEIPTFDKIYYWQEEDYQSTIENIVSSINSSYLSDKSSDTYNNFNTDKEINYTNIGRIAFLLTGEYTNYWIYDNEDVDISDSFDSQIINDLHSKLFVSKNIISYGDIKFKIKKI